MLVPVVFLVIGKHCKQPKWLKSIKLIMLYPFGGILYTIKMTLKLDIQTGNIKELLSRMYKSS